MTTLEEINALTRPNHPDDWTEVDTRAVDTVRVLAADAVQKVGSGHPGTAMSLAPLAYTLFQRQMHHDPSDTSWLGRDRFVLSCGHSSLTLYIQLYLGGFGLELSDIQALRTFKSKTPGHPEFRHTRGVEITTGPLGQGLASSVGMAMASRYERGLFDPDTPWGESPFDHYIYVIASDGDIEEGVTSEASSLAGTQQLGNLIVFYDKNQISIEHDTNIALSEDVAARYRAYGWHVQEIEGGENVVAIEQAIAEAKKVTDKPSFIALRTIIGYPAPNKMNTGGVHGSALGEDEVAATKKVLGFDPDQTFEVSDEVISHTRKLVDRGREAHQKWQSAFDAWAEREPERKKLLDRLLAQELPDGWDADITYWEPGSKAMATRKAFGEVLNDVAPKLPELWGGSADPPKTRRRTGPRRRPIVSGNCSTNCARRLTPSRGSPKSSSNSCSAPRPTNIALWPPRSRATAPGCWRASTSSTGSPNWKAAFPKWRPGRLTSPRSCAARATNCRPCFRRAWRGWRRIGRWSVPWSKSPCRKRNCSPGVFSRRSPRRPALARPSGYALPRRMAPCVCDAPFPKRWPRRRTSFPPKPARSAAL